MQWGSSIHNIDSVCLKLKVSRRKEVQVYTNGLFQVSCFIYFWMRYSNNIEVSIIWEMSWSHKEETYYFYIGSKLQCFGRSNFQQNQISENCSLENIKFY